MREKTDKLIAFSADVSKRAHSEWIDLAYDDVHTVKMYLLDVCTDKEEHK